MSLPFPVPDEDLLRSAPDLFSRHYRVFAAVERLRDDGQSFRILDVGGRAGLSKRFFPDDDVTIVDVRADQDDVVSVAPGAPLPFADDEFDVAVSFDVLEHVLPAHRSLWLAECGRVAREAAFFTVPEAAAIEVERRANRVFEALEDRPHPWLHEHEELGVPSRAEIAEMLDALPFAWRRHSSNPIDAWFHALTLGFVRDFGRDVLDRPDSVLRFNEKFFPGDALEPGYRAIYAVANAGSPALDAPAIDASEAEEAPDPYELGLVDLHRIERTLRAGRDSLAAELEQTTSELKASDAARAEMTDTVMSLQAATEALRADVEALNQAAAETAHELASLRGRFLVRLDARLRRLIGR